MFAIERIKIIKNHLLKEQKVSVAKLSELLNVTEVTIRRDLEKLEHEGFLKRTHGGAVLTDYVEDALNGESEDFDDFINYQEIADTASRLVNDGESIMLTSGLINQFIARSLGERSGISIVTNDFQIAQNFQNQGDNCLIFLGGDMDDKAVYGQMTLDNLRNFSFDHVFIEVDGLHETNGITVNSTKKATLIQKAAALSESVNIVCLSKNFGSRSLYRVGKFEMASRILTDSKLDDHFKSMIYNHKIPLFTSIDVYEN